MIQPFFRGTRQRRNFKKGVRQKIYKTREIGYLCLPEISFGSEGKA
jgi:hypothetical protein